MITQPNPQTLAEVVKALTMVNRRLVRWTDVAHGYLGDAGDDQASRNLDRAVKDLDVLIEQIKHLSTQTK